MWEVEWINAFDTVPITSCCIIVTGLVTEGKNYSEEVQKSLKIIIIIFYRLLLQIWIYRVVIQSCDCTWAALVKSHWPNTVTGQIKPQVLQTLLLWMSYFSRLTAALHGPTCCPHTKSFSPTPWQDTPRYVKRDSHMNKLWTLTFFHWKSSCYSPQQKD